MGSSDLTRTWGLVLLQNILMLRTRVRKASDQYIEHMGCVPTLFYPWHPLQLLWRPRVKRRKKCLEPAVWKVSYREHSGMVPWNGQWACHCEGSLVICLFKWSEDVVWGILRSAWVVQLHGWEKKGRGWGEGKRGREEGRLRKFTYTGLQHPMPLWMWVPSPFTDGKTKVEKKVNAELGFKLRSVAKVCVQLKHTRRNYFSRKSLGEIRRWDSKEFPFSKLSIRG